MLRQTNLLHDWLLDDGLHYWVTLGDRQRHQSANFLREMKDKVHLVRHLLGPIRQFGEISEMVLQSECSAMLRE